MLFLGNVSSGARQHDAPFLLFLHLFGGGGLISVASKILSYFSHLIAPKNIIG